MVYAIYEEFYPEVEKKLTRIAKKCAKYGNPFTFEVKGEEIRAIKKHEDNVYNPNAPVEYFKFVMVDVEGTAKIDNWECIAVLENHDSGNIIRRINTEIEIPERFKTSDNICEHCNSKRNRNNLYVIHNTQTEEWKQVGGNCLRLYTGGLNLEFVTAWLDGITELEEMDGVMGGNSKPYFTVKNILAFAVEVIGKTGYFNSQSNLPTKGLVEWLVYRPLGEAIYQINKELEEARMPIRFCSDDFLKEETNETVEAIIDYYKGLEDNSEFIHNIKVMLEEGYVFGKNIGFLCYLPEGYARHMQREIERVKRMEEKHEHFGEVGKRYKGYAVQNIRLVTAWEGFYGVTYIYKITLEGGEVLMWKTSKSLYMEDCQVCDKIDFTVKEHGEYKGEKQTEVTRCKITFKEEMKKGA